MVISAHEKTLEEIKGHFLENCKRRGRTGRIRCDNSSVQKMCHQSIPCDAYIHSMNVTVALLNVNVTLSVGFKRHGLAVFDWGSLINLG
jgi:hypothetical protein